MQRFGWLIPALSEILWYQSAQEGPINSTAFDYSQSGRRISSEMLEQYLLAVFIRTVRCKNNLG